MEARESGDASGQYGDNSETLSQVFGSGMIFKFLQQRELNSAMDL